MVEKLIRDKIPEIARAKGDSPLNIRVASREEMPGLLVAKLEEEVAEFLTAKTKEEKLAELVDVLNVVSAIAETLNVTIDELTSMMFKKAYERGFFHERLVLAVEPETLCVDGIEDSRGIKYIGLATKQSNGKWNCLAIVDSALAVVEVTITINPESKT